MALFSKFFGRTIGEAAAFALGGAIRSPLEPPLVELTNETWARFVDQGVTVPTDAETAAAIAAEDVATVEWAKGQAKQRGIGGDQMDKMIGEQLNAPGVPQLLTLWRRGEISDGDFLHGLRKTKLEGRWDTPLRALKTDRLAPAQIALGIVRSLFDSHGLLVGEHDTTGGVVPSTPVTAVDPIAEAAAAGIDAERLRVMVGEIGLPMSLQQAASAYFRGIIEHPDFYLAVAQGDTRPAWADAILEQARQIPSVVDAVQLYLRGWTDEAGMNARAARHGMSADDTHDLFLIHGRPPSWHQVWIGLQRGGVYDGPTDEIDPAFLKALRESDLRPEWYNLLWHSRYTYPSTFILRTMTEAGDITEAEAEQILQFEGWEPTLRAKVAKRWANTQTGQGTGPAKKAETSLLTALHKAYVDDREDEQTARTVLGFLNVAADEQDRTIEVWNRERQLVRSYLSAAQIKKAVGQPGRDQAWALERLAELGYTQADALTFLAE